MAELPSGRVPSGIGGVSQFEAPRNQVVQRRPGVWAEAGPKFAEILLANMLKQYQDQGKIQQAALAAGYEAVPEGQTPDPNRQVRQIGGKSYYAPMQSVYGVGPEGTLQNLGQVPEGAKVEQLKQQQPKDVTFWRGPKGDTVQLPKNDPRGGQLLQAGYLPFNIYKEQQELNRAGQPTPSMQENAAKAAFIEKNQREPNAQEWNDILATVHHPEMTLTGGNYTPEQRGLAKKLVAGDIPYPSAFALRSPYWQGIIQAAQEEDPTFNASQYQTRAAVRRSFTSGPDARNVTSINTLVGHLNSLDKSAKALDNSGWSQTYNTVANALETEFGDPRTTKFGEDLDAVSSEMAAVFKGMGATDQEIKAWRGRINSSQSPEQLKAAIDEAYELMGSRLQALRTKYDQGMGQFGQLRILSPKSRQLLSNRFGADYVNALEPEAQPGGGGATPQPGQPGQRSPSSVVESGW